MKSRIRRLIGAVATSRRGRRALWNQLLRRTELDDEMRFMALCANLNNRSTAQLYQDVFVLYETGLKRGGVFVEIGATDGLVLSNTAMLEGDFGWTGLLVEPNPHWHEALHRNRDAVVDTRCVWSRTGETASFAIAEDHEFGGIAETLKRGTSPTENRIEVATITLNDLLAEHEICPDYLSIDTEGSEWTILERFDLATFRPHVITVEHNEHMVDIKGLLIAKGYVQRFPDLSVWDGWYVRI